LIYWCVGAMPGAPASSSHHPPGSPHRWTRVQLMGAFRQTTAFGAPSERGDSIFYLLAIFGIPLAVGFAAGYAFRAYLSRRNRRLAQQYSLHPAISASPDQRR